MSENIEVNIKGTQDVDKAAKKASDGLKDLGKSAGTTQDNLAKYAESQVSASTGLSSFVSQITPANIALAALAAAVAKVSTTLYDLSVKSFTIADQWASVVNDIEDKTDMAAESASRLAGVAQVVGLSGADMGQALALMSRNAQAAAEQIKAAADAGTASEDDFTKWGISITDTNGDLLSAEQIYENINKRHREMANGVQKTAMEMEIFGRSGAKMNDLLNLSEQQVNDTTATLQELGMVINHDTSQAFEDLDQKGRLVSLCFDGLYNQMGEAFIPVVDEARDMLIDLAKELNNSGAAMDFAHTMADAAQTSLYAMKGAADVCKDAYENLIKPIWDACDALDSFIKKVTGLDGLRLFSDGIGLLADIGKYNQRIADEEKQKAWLANGGMSSGNSDDWDLATNTAAKNTALLNAAALNSDAAKKNQEAANANLEAVRKAEEIAKQQDSIITIADALAEAGTKFGVNGCTAFADAALANTKWAGLFNGEGLDVGVARARADAAGLFHTGTEGMSRGDVIVYANDTYKDGSHVGIYDGYGGVYHNSTSAGNRAYHASDYTAMGPGTSVLGYIATGGSEANANQLGAYKTMLAQAQKAQEELKKGKDAATDALKEISLKVLEMTGSAYDVATEKAKRTAMAYQDIIDNAAGKGLNTKALSDELNRYTKLIKAKIDRDNKAENHNNVMGNLAQNIADRTSYASTVRDLQMQELKSYQNILKKEIASNDLSEKEKLELRKQYGEAQVEYETLAAQKTSTAWNVAADQLLNRTTNFAAMVVQATDNINNSILSSMQNWVGSEESLGDRLIKLWQNVANSVINMIVQIALQQSVLTPLSNAIGSMFKGFGGFGGSNTSNTSSTSFNYSGLWNGSNFSSFSDLLSYRAFASGGYSPAGLRIVGENGPELEDTRTPGRVYTNDQLRDALGGSSRGPQVVMNISTPDAGSFKQSRSQLAASVAAMVQRGQG